jgi:hypothetical protein
VVQNLRGYGLDAALLHENVRAADAQPFVVGKFLVPMNAVVVKIQHLNRVFCFRVFWHFLPNVAEWRSGSPVFKEIRLIE